VFALYPRTEGVLFFVREVRVPKSTPPPTPQTPLYVGVLNIGYTTTCYNNHECQADVYYLSIKLGCIHTYFHGKQMLLAKSVFFICLPCANPTRHGVRTFTLTPQSSRLILPMSSGISKEPPPKFNSKN